LLGLIREEDGGSATMLRSLDIAPEQIREKIDEILVPGPEMVARPDLPYTSRAKKVLELTMQECVRTRTTTADTQHLLVALCVEGKGIAAEVLRLSGLTTDVARAAFDQLSGGNGKASPS
ncbi:MAG: hypothetical protein JF589_16925, partial [Gemmatimonadetes bacterium]|nr:hypothetical protein [Gemmatimonadota bacterium]